MKKKRLVLKTLAVAVFSGLSLMAAQAESNPLVGSWEHTERATQQGPAFTMRMIFTADGIYELDVAVPSGVTVTKGIYQLTSDSSFVGEVKSSMLCASGNNCIPNPMPVQYGVPGTSNFQMQNQDQLVLDNKTWYRTR
jgi:hypothetical protein